MSDWLRLRADWQWRTVADLQADGVLLVEDGNHGEYRPRPDEFVTDGTAFLRAADLADGRPLFTTAGKIDDTALGRIRKGIGAPDDIIFSHKGTVGKVARAPVDSPPYVCSPQTTFWRVLSPHIIDRDFLFVYMRSPEFIRQWTARKGDTDMADYVSLTAQRTLLVPLPPIDSQRRIAAVASVLDDLIENDNRRIKILEEMAERIYREWFVDFRYPGHEDVPSVDSALGPIPEEWTVGPLGEAMELVYGKALKADDRKGGAVRVFGSSGVVGFHDEFQAPGPGIVVGRKGNVGSVHWSQGPFFVIDTAFWVRTPLPLTYCYFVLRNMNFIDSHSSVPGLSRGQAYGLTFLTPAQPQLDRFDSLVSPLFLLKDILSSSTGTLRSARDLLVPRLISGEINVENLDIPLDKVAA